MQEPIEQEEMIIPHGAIAAAELCTLPPPVYTDPPVQQPPVRWSELYHDLDNKRQQTVRLGMQPPDKSVCSLVKPERLWM